MTIDGLSRFLHINYNTWLLYKKREDFIEVTRDIESVIYEQKFTGASADLLNSNIIARDLGLIDKTKTDHTGDLTVGAYDLTETERSTRIAALLNTARSRRDGEADND